MAKYGKIWQISKIILNHFVRCRLSPLECCVSQGLFDYSTYKSLMARCRRAHSTRQSVHNPYLISDLNLISLVRQCQGSAKAHETRGENRACTECSSATSRHGLEKPWHDFSKALRRLYAACHILSYLVISCHILSYEVE